MRLHLVPFLLLGLLGSGCPRPAGPDHVVEPPHAPPERIVQLGELDGIGLLQLYLDGWDELTREQRLLAYHLSLAAIAGDPIAYDQRHARNLELKALLEGIGARGSAVDPDVRRRLDEYLRLFWIHHGLHDGTTFEKLPPRFTFDELWMASLSAFASGERFGFLDEDELRAAIDDLRPLLFDRETDRWLVRRNPPEGEDALSAGASNLYPEDITAADLDEFHRRHAGLSSLRRDADGGLVEQVYRAGRDDVPPGLYAPQLQRVAGHVRDALPYATETQRAVLEALLDALATGERSDWQAYEAAWVADDPVVESVFGFVETDEDPGGTTGTWEGLVLIRDEARTARLRRLEAETPEFLARAPWPEDLARPAPADPATPAAAVERQAALQVLTATGDAALLTPSALSLPNDPLVRREDGSKNLQLVNVDDALRAVHLEPAIREFAADDAEAAEARRCGAAAWEALLALHDVVGHAVLAPPANDDATTGTTLAEYAGVLAEARADLLALHFAEDPRVVELGLLPDRACGEAAARDYVRGTLPMLRALDSDDLHGDGPRAHLLVVRYAVERGTVAVERTGGKTFLRLPDVSAWRDVVDELLTSIERARVEGDYDAARALVETYGARAPEGWREEAARRAELAGLPARFALLPPSLDPVRDATGAIVDVRLVAPVDFTTLMLSWQAVADEPLPPPPPPAPPSATPEPTPDQTPEPTPEDFDD